ncbi:hypothetical protein F4804DRAFT_303701 [Jackrogersella minutella]|nr:hypothetical protein F4804DRAFT_303701 [Jackrogersella minutella]
MLEQCLTMLVLLRICYYATWNFPYHPMVAYLGLNLRHSYTNLISILSSAMLTHSNWVSLTALHFIRSTCRLRA